MAGLNLFPARVSIGSVVDAAGTKRDVYMSPEFSRALAALFDRVGGPTNMGLGEVTSLVGELLTFDAFDSVPTSQIAQLRDVVEDLQRTFATTPDQAARVAEAYKELARRPSTLAQAAPGTSITGTLAATVLATIVVPANAMGKNGMVRISTSWSMTNSENEKTLVLRFGGSAIASDVVTTATNYQTQQRIQNKNSTSAQVFIFGGAAYTGSPISTASKDTTATQNIDIVGQLANAGETITLEAYTVELIPFA